MVWSDMDAIDSSGQVIAPKYLRTMYGSYQYFPTPRELFETELKTNENILTTSVTLPKPWFWGT